MQQIRTRELEAVSWHTDDFCLMEVNTYWWIESVTSHVLTGSLDPNASCPVSLVLKQPSLCDIDIESGLWFHLKLGSSYGPVIYEK